VGSHDPKAIFATAAGRNEGFFVVGRDDLARMGQICTSGMAGMSDGLYTIMR
jgi:hypothetical protein